MMKEINQLADEPSVYKILTNNEDRVMCALRWLNAGLDEVLFLDVDHKNSADAIMWINAGNQAFSESRFIDSTYAYTRAIMYAKSGSSDLARAYANRSAATCEVHMYKASLKDIDRALVLGYPDNLKAKLYIRQVKCLWGINKKFGPEIKSSIINAEKWIEKVDQHDRKKLQTALDSMRTRDILKYIYPLVEGLSSKDGFMPATPTDNVKMLRTSKCIQLKYSDAFGRHVVATRDIKAGQTLHVNESYSSIAAFRSESDRKFLSAACWNCFNAVISCVPCTQCVNMNYCGEKCRDEDWANYHEFDCHIMSQLLAFGVGRECYLSLRIVIKAFKEAGSFQRLKDQISRINSITDPLEKLMEDEVYNSSKYTSVYGLIADNSPCDFDLAVRAATVLMLLSGLTKIFGREIKKIKDIIDHKWTTFIGSLILTNFQVVNAYGFEQTSLPNNAPQDVLVHVAHSLQPLVALCNHSCNPNAGIFFRGKVIAIIALQKIASGQQIFLAYDDVDFQKYPRNVRRERLQEKYQFKCTCIACKNDWNFDAMKFYKDVLMTDRKKQDLEITMHKLYKLCSTTGDRRLPEELQLLKDVLNIFDPTTQDSCREYFVVKSTLRDFYKSVSS